MSLLVKIGADLSSFQKQMKKATRDIKYVADQVGNIGAQMSTKLTLPIVGIGAAALKVGMDFETSMSKVSAITGATGDEFERLEQTAKDLGASTKFSAKQSAEAMTYLGMAGYDTNQIIESMPGLLDLAAASGSELAKVSDIVSDAMTAFGMSAKETTKFADLLASTSTKANTNVEMLGESFKYVAPVAGALGYTAEDTALALGLMANAGIKASDAGTSLRGALTRMVNGTGEAGEMIKELGIQLTDASGNMLPMKDVLDQLRSSFSTLTAEQQAQYASTIFGQEAMSGMLAIINTGAEDYKTLTEATTNYDGVAKQMADTMQNNLGGSVEQLKSALSGIAIQLSETLIPIATSVVEKLKVWVDWFSNLDESTQKMIMTISAIVAAMGPLIFGITKTIALFAQLKAAALILSTAIGAITLKAVLITGAIGAVIAIGILLYKNWDTVKEKSIQIWNGIKEAVRGPANAIIGFANGVIAAYERMINGMASAVNRIPSISIPDWVPVFGGKSYGIPRIPRVRLPRIPQLATGTNYVPNDMLAVIHKGEAVVPKKYNPAATGSGVGELKRIEIPLYLDGREIARATYDETSYLMQQDYINTARSMGIK